MKRFLALLLAALMLLTLAACGSETEAPAADTPAEDASGTDAPAEDAGTETEHVHTEETMPAVEPTCTETGLTEGVRCTECGEILVPQETVAALGHTTDSGTCERCGQTFGVWETAHYVDEFDQPMEDAWYLINNPYAVGTFSNSATTNSDLAVYMTYDYQGRIAFLLYEYGWSQAKNVWDTDTYRVVMRTQDGTDAEMQGYFYENGDRLVLDDGYVDDVIAAMTSQGEVSCYLQSGSFETTSYLFTVDTAGFAEQYAAVQPAV